LPRTYRLGAPGVARSLGDRCGASPRFCAGKPAPTKGYRWRVSAGWIC